ncbi:MAG: hypothetical protein LBC41_07295 [Clostridiales bacterium]|nr:hypothetical protein [Clostridiales bacterium]MDR2750447.1 hypothetical protein [Clostridiales bacterium]
MGITLTLKDVVYSALLAFVLTGFVLGLVNMLKSALERPLDLEARPKDMGKILQKCYALFPNDIIQFQGVTFTRGMQVRVRTSQHKTFEGQLIGLNKENMLCLLTKRYIVAHELDKIEEMNLLA